jgi:hypothetical protein
MSIRDKIAPHLIEGETILWSGHPRFNLVLRLSVAVLRVAGSGLLIATIVFFIGNLSGDSSIILAKFLLIIFSLSLLLFPDLITRSRKGTYYAVTNRRVISLFDGKGTNFLGRFLPADVKLVELPIDTIKDVAIEKYIGNLVGVIFTDGSNFFLPPYIIMTSDGDIMANAIIRLNSCPSRPFGYLRSYSGSKNDIFCFSGITKGEAGEITHLIKNRLSN